MLEWQVVGRRGRNKKEQSLQYDPRLNSALSTQPGSSDVKPEQWKPTQNNKSDRKHQWLESISQYDRELQHSQLLKAVRAAFQIAAADSVSSEEPSNTVPAWDLQNLQALVVWGLGSLSSGVSRAQAAFALQLTQLLPGLKGPAEVYDPVFTQDDNAILSDLEMQVAGRNDNGARIAEVPTLFYLAHCEAELCIALLEANAAARTLHNVTILGNSLKAYCSRRHLTAQQQAIMQSAICQEIAIPELDMQAGGAFNDMALHIL